MTRPPVIVLGAHRSGTSALSRILDELGVFVGSRLDRNHESWFFLRLNVWLLAQCGGRWDHPEPFHALLADPDRRRAVLDYLALSLRSPRAIGYLGVRRWLTHRRIERLDTPWGWKDPRNTFTLPLWLELFPDARVLHIHRHGVDVAQSLVRRGSRMLQANVRGFERWRAAHRVVPKIRGFGESARCATLDGAFSLWEEYVHEARRQIEVVGPERALELRYEDLAVRPREVVARIATFCGAGADDATIARAAALVSAQRASAFENDPRLVEFAHKVAARVARARPPASATAPAVTA